MILPPDHLPTDDQVERAEARVELRALLDSSGWKRIERQLLSGIQESLNVLQRDAEEALQSVETDPVATAKQLADCVVRLTHVIDGMRRSQDRIVVDWSPFRSSVE